MKKEIGEGRLWRGTLSHIEWRVVRWNYNSIRS